MSRSARYTFILIVVALSGCLAAFGGWRFAKASAPVNGPIVLISIDSLRADHVGAYGYRAGRTPSIDHLADDGIVFERAYAHVPQTLPAHVAMLTGRLPFENGVRDTVGFRLTGSSRTIAELLRDRGYATGAVVSSFLLRKDTGIDRGFTFFDAELPVRDEATPFPSLMRDGADSEQVAEHWLDSVGTARAFLFLHIAEPHAPHTAPKGLDDPAPYDTAVTRADESVGRLIRYLKAHQLYDRSTILLVSDHGEGLGDHGEQAHGLLAYEESLRVPLIVKPPAGDNSKRRVSAPVQQADIVPTILDLAKAPGASGLRGRSLTPFFSGGSVADTAIYAESFFGALRFGWSPVRTIIKGQRQLVSDGNRDELFDLSRPAGARQDIAADEPGVAAALRKELDGFEPKVSRPTPFPTTAADRERFELLGYVGTPVALTQAADVGGTGPDEQVLLVERFRTAVQLAYSGEWKKAIEIYRTLTHDHPAMADLWLHLAQTAARNERQDVAVDAYRQALALEPDNTTAALGAASSSLRARRLDDAARFAQAVLDGTTGDDVEKAEAHELLARVALNHREYERARAEAAAAEAADVHRPVLAFVDGRIAMDQRRYAEAVAAFEEALAAAAAAGRAPLADLRVYAAESMLQVKRAEDAERLLNEELEAFPANLRARSALQVLYRRSGRAPQAAALAQH